MKSFVLLSFLALAPATCLAQTKPDTTASAMSVSIDPAASALLDVASAQYRSATGVRFDVTVTENKKVTRSRVSFRKPNLLRIENTSSGDASRTFTLVSDGKMRTLVRGKTFESRALSGEMTQMWTEALSNGTGFAIPMMLQGKSVIGELRKMAQQAPGAANMKMNVTLPAPMTVGGEMLSGIKFNLSSDKPLKNNTVVHFWFGADGLLRRVTTSDVSSTNRRFESTEVISNQQLSPTFASNAFAFNATGLKDASKAADPPEEPAYFDPRVKVGAQPFAFSAKTLNGQTISPAKYRGKVLIMDFWATWCGPCVAALPELQATYNKYHSKGVEVVGISLDEDKSALTSFIKTNKMPWPQVFDGKGWESRVPGIYGVKAIPFLLIVGKNGKIAAVNPREDLEGAVKRALAAK